MPAAENLALARKFNELYNLHSSDPTWLDQIDALVTDDFTSVDIPTGVTTHGKQEFKRYFQGWATAFSDGRIEITSAAATDDMSVVEFIGRGTHDGPLSGPAGDIPPTGKHAEVRYCSVSRFVNGKVSESRLYYDALSILTQLGVIAAPATAQARG
ncbi:MAG TPA: ester cyclase [Ktedonobacterales bacterium]|jgi:ketosteroid isomerase-like protein|nr:ester cyclase [Ktedonobacterales bacterium]